ncbi:MAG: hypothetical protein JWN74_3078 [Acidobacteriaceae bacterium]|nr:hypothetical protein [Acidobacteriaceae bacterium]
MMGPILTFDKSFLQCINADESVWLDKFFVCNICPLFIAETLADLEKTSSQDRPAAKFVATLANKTPDIYSHINVYHRELVSYELTRGKFVPMNGTIIKGGGKPVRVGDSQGVVYKVSDEEEALNRWIAGDFLDVERQHAKRWRESVSNVDHSHHYATIRELYQQVRMPRTLADAKHIADSYMGLLEERQALQFGMYLIGIPADNHGQIIERWVSAGKPPLPEFTPYFWFLCSVDLFFFLALGADLISRVRPTNKADNMIDLSYLYYLPFCSIFVSNDNLHKRIVPLFLRGNQTNHRRPGTER